VRVQRGGIVYGLRAAALLSTVLAAGALAACGSDSATTDSPASSGQSSRSVQAAPVALHLNQGSYSVSRRGTTISGTASQGAAVTVNGNRVAVRSGHWRESLSLHIGNNPVEVEATISGRPGAARTIHVVRHHSAAELEALAHARALRAEANRRHEAEARERRERVEAEKAERDLRQRQAECPNGSYTNSAGNSVCKPYESETVPPGATARCEDGTYSESESRSGTCSHHGGVAVWLNE
jgi:hypothetical protein